MAGTILIILGIILIVVGIVLLIKADYKKTLYNSNAKIKIETNLEIIEKNNETGEEKIIKTSKFKKEIDFEKNRKEQEIQNLINLAVADGVVTKNEKEIIIKKAIELNLNIKDIENQLYAKLKKKQNNPETKLIDKQKEKGDLFESFVVTKFDKKYFTLKEWAGDKYVNGIYAETTIQPDLKYSFKLREIEIEFAIECKYRSNYFKNGVEWAKKSQLNNYRKFAEQNKIHVFVAIGVGGTAKQPSELFIIPLKNIQYTFLNREFLEKYKKNNLQTNFHFNYKNFKLT